MKTPLQILFLGSNLEDFQRVKCHLEQNVLPAEFHRAATLAELQTLLERDTWDVVLADYPMQDVEWEEVLHILKPWLEKLPFILITGRIGEERAVQLLKLGVWDLLLKDNLTRLVPAIEQSVQDEGLRRSRRGAESALRSVKEQPTSFLNSDCPHIAVLDQGGRVTAISTFWERFASENPFIGATSSHPCGVGADYLSLCRQCAEASSGTAQAMHNGIQAVINGQSPSFSLEYCFHSSSGQNWYLLTVTPLNQECSWVVISHLNTTDRVGLNLDRAKCKRLEHEREAALIKYHTLFDSFPLGITVVDRQGRIVESNRIAEQILGISIEHQLQRHVGGAEWKIVRPDGTPMPPEEFASTRALQEQRTVRDVEMGLVKSPTETTWISVTAAPVPLPDIGVVIAYSDISARRRAEAALNEGEARWKTLFDHSPVSIWEEDFSEVKKRLDALRASGIQDLANYLHTHPDEVARCAAAVKILQVNQTSADCLSTDTQSISRQLPTYFTAASFEIFADELAALAAGNRHWEGDIPILTPEGEEREFRLFLSIVPDHEATWNFVIVSFIDITERKRTEHALRESELRRRLAVEAAQLGTWEWNLVTGKHIWSEIQETLWGYTPGTFPGTTDAFTSRIHPIDLPEIWLAGNRAKENRRPFRTEYRVLRPDGSMRWIASHGQLQFNAQGTPIYAMGVVLDITERKRSEEALVLEATRRRILVEGSRDGIVVLDQQGRVFEANRHFAEMLGYSVDEVHQLCVWDWNVPLTREQLLEAIRILGPEGDFFETCHRRKDGSMFQVEVSSNGAELGGQKLIFCVCRDISERKQAELVLQQSLLFRHEAEKIARIGAWKVNPESDYLYWTKGVYEILGIPLDYKPGLQEGLKYYDSDSIPVLQAALQKTLQDGTPFTIEAGVTTLSGRKLRTEVRGFRYMQEGGQSFVMGTFQDITERKQAEEALRASEVRFRGTLESMMEGCQIIGFNWKYHFINTVAAGQGKMTVQELTGCTMMEAYPGIETTDVFRRLKQCMQNRVPQAFENEFVFPEGAKGWYQLLVQPVPEGIFILSLDITERKKAEMALSERQEIFSNIVGQASDAIAVVDGVTGQFVEFNTAAHEGLGYTRTEFAELGIAQIQAENSPEAIQQNLDSVRKRGALSFESKHRHRNGSLRDVRVSIRQLHIQDHDYMAVVWTDTTERKRSEARVAKDALRIEFLLELHQRAPQMTDHELYDHVLERAVQLTESTIGFFHHVSEDQRSILLTTWNREALKNCTADFDQHYPVNEAGNWVNCIRERRPVVYNDYANSPNQRGLPTGHAPVHRFMSIPVIRDGKVSIIFGVGNKAADYDDSDVAQLQVVANELHKIMTQRAAQNQLRKSEERFRHLVETTCDWIWETDAGGRYIYASPKVKDLLGYLPEEILGKKPLDLIAAADQERVRSIFSEIIAARRPFSALENTNLHKNGHLVELETSGVPVLGHQGELLGYRGVDRDISERKRLEAQFRQAQKLEAVGQLAGGVAHDFNNILAAIIMQLGFLQADPDLTQEMRQALMELGSEAQRAATLTRQLLMFSRRSVLAVKPLDLNEVVANLLKMLNRLIGENIRLRFDSGNHLPSVEADAGMLEQVLVNLVVNARDAMPKGGEITIATSLALFDEADVALNPSRHQGRFICLAASDTGSGMNEATLKRIFEPFFTTKESGKGTGLGLATVHGIVTQHKGWVEVESEVDKGTTFRVFLPALAQAATQAVTQAVDAGPDETLPGGCETLLLVEDEAILRRIIAQALRSLGYRVYDAQNGQEAMRLWQIHQAEIDLLLSDMVMPEGMTGLELTEQLQASKPGLKAIISSGYSAEITRLGVSDKPGIIYLPKPYEMTQLAETVRNCLKECP